MTALAAIFATIDARLSAVAGLGEYERMPAGDPAAFPALAAYDGGDEPVERETDTTRLRLTLTVEGYVEAYSGAAAHDAMAALHAAAVRALCDDGNLGGLAELIEVDEKRRVDIAELASARRLGFAQDFTIHYATARGDPGTIR